MKKENFNWGIIGPGRIAQKFAKSLEVIENTTLYAVASNNKERANSFAKEFSADKSYYSYQDLFNDEEIDAIYIATPHRFHFENAKLCLEAGKHVLCEKPITVNASEAKSLIDLARSKNLFLMEALWTCYIPIYEVIKKWLDDKIIGEVKLMNSTFGFNFPRELEDRKFNHDLAGGGLLDLGVYSIAISQWVLEKDPISFSASAFLGETKVDEMLAVNLNYGNGVISQFSCNFLSKNDNNFIIYGTKGQITIHPNFWGSTQATLQIDDEKTVITKEFRGNGFEYQIEEAMNCIQNGKIESQIMSHKNSLANMELMDKIRERIGLKYNFE